MINKAYRKKKDRPVLDLPRTYGDWFFDVASLGGLILMVSCLVYFWPLLPETIPTHFGFSGAPDDWGSKNTLFLLPGLGLILYISLTVVGFFPHTYNYLWAITEKNARLQYKLAKALMGWLKVEIIWLFLYITWKTILVSLGRSAGLGIVFLPIFMAVTFGTLGIYFYLSARSR